MSLTITPSPFGSLLVSVAETGSTLSVTTVATSPSVLSMALGVPGPQGDAGPAGQNGSNGVGVPVGGTAGQALVKLSGTNYDTGWTTISSGGTWGSITGTLSNQTDLYDALNGKLSLSGGTLSGPITFSTDGTNDSEVGAWGFGVENTSGSVAIVEPSLIHIYDTVNTNGISIAPSQITFNDGSTQASAYNPSVLNGYLPLTGGTLTINDPSEFIINVGDSDGYNGGSVRIGYGDGVGGQGDHLTLSSGGSIGFYSNTDPGYNGGAWIKFNDNTIQSTAFPPSGGTTSQYIDGTGALQTFPTVTSVAKMTLVAYNQTGATIPQGAVVYITGSHGNDPQITLAIADTEAHSAFSIGVAQSAIPNNTNGTFVTAGLLENFDTHSYADGTPLYLSPTVAGGLTSTKPLAPNHYTKIGTVIRSHPTLGTVFIKIENGYQLDEMSDVSFSTLANGNVLTYDSATSLWKNKTVTSALGYAPANDVLGNLSSSSTARTNLGLGSMATQSTSAYLSTSDAASTYLTISSAASTYQPLSGMSSYLTTSSASSTYQTQSAMSAYLSTSAASTTYIAQSSYATTTQAQAGSSTSAVISASTLQDAKYFAGGKSIVQITWSTAVSGTGASASAQNANARLNAGPTSATGYAIATAVIANNSRGAIFNSGFDFSKRVSFGVRVARNVASPDTNSVFRYSIGKSSSTDASDLSARGLMIKVAGTGALQLLVHNGTTLTTTTSSYTPTNGVGYDVLVVSDGSGNVTLYVNGSSVATSTGGPTSAGSTNANVLMFEIQNTATLSASPQNICISDYFVQVNS